VSITLLLILRALLRARIWICATACVSTERESDSMAREGWWWSVGPTGQCVCLWVGWAMLDARGLHSELRDRRSPCGTSVHRAASAAKPDARMLHDVLRDFRAPVGAREVC
jgi:hypothetical protein